MFLTGSLSFICIVFTCFLQTPFFHLHAFYMFLTGPLFSFTWLLHVSYTPPFFIYMVFTWCSYRPPFFIYTTFTCFLQAPFFHLHGFYMFLSGPLFSFTWFSLGYKHSISRLFTAFAWIIYTFLTWFSKAIYMFFTKADTVKVRKTFYRFLHVLQMIIADKDNVNHYLQNINMLY